MEVPRWQNSKSDRSLSLRKDEDIRAKYQARLEQKMLSNPVALELNQKWKNPVALELNQKWKKVEEAILLAAKILQEPQRKKYEGWFDEECKRVLEERAKMKLKMVTKSSERCKEAYQESRRKAKQTCFRIGLQEEPNTN
ncbi:hypothetical protein QE152_g11345 [Popillia japonica]|uniref:Uncharacterized protein n=1 Tax=Popillia japonica TaxID=7064 RepID=A0AAW1LS91_POPJA